MANRLGEWHYRNKSSWKRTVDHTESGACFRFKKEPFK